MMTKNGTVWYIYSIPFVYLTYNSTDDGTLAMLPWSGVKSISMIQQSVRMVFYSTYDREQ